MEQQNVLLLSSEVSRIFQVSSETVREWQRTGKLPARKTAGGVRLYDLNDVLAFKVRREAALRAAADLAAVSVEPALAGAGR